MKKIRYIFQAGLVKFVFWLLRRFSIEKSSDIGSWLARKIGPKTGVQKTALRQLKMALPNEDHEKILDGMWENLGRNIGEFVHFNLMSREKFKEYVTIEGMENVEEARAMGKGGIYLSGHFGNWEVTPNLASYYGFKTSALYRKMNNDYLENYIKDLREAGGTDYLQIGKKGLGQLIKALRNKEFLAILVDQKYRRGSMIDFFGTLAPTTTFAAELAVKYGCPVIYARCIRTDKCRLRVIIEKPVIYDCTAEELMQDANKRIESWVRERPDHWFWVHKRWDVKK